jgi:hypothetical protein
MTDKQPVDDKVSSDHEDDPGAGAGENQNGYEEELAKYETELAQYLQERIKPGLTSSAIPLMARSIAKEIAHRESPTNGPEDPDAEDGQEADGSPDFEADMHELQAELGNDWILRFSVQGERGWLTAEKEDGSQRLEAPNAQVLMDAVQLLDEGGGRSD